MRYTYSSDDAAYVRGLIDPLASVDEIPDASIVNDYVTATAESWMLGILGSAVDVLTPEQDTTAKLATLGYLASTLIAQTPVITRGQLGEGSYQVREGDPERRVAMLERRSRQILAGLRDAVVEPATRRHFVFSIARGGRAK